MQLLPTNSNGKFGAGFIQLCGQQERYLKPWATEAGPQWIGQPLTVGSPRRAYTMSIADEIVNLVGAGKTMAQIAKKLKKPEWVLFKEVRNALDMDRLIELAAEQKAPTDIAKLYGVSVSVVYKQIRCFRLQYLFFDQLVACRDVCPIIVRLMGMTGANLNELRRAAYPQFRYARLQRFVEREGMAHYFKGEPLLPKVQWVDKCEPLFKSEDIAERVMRNDSPHEYEAQEQHAPTLRTVYKRLGATNWEEAQANARHILKGE